MLKGDGDHCCKARARLALHVSLSWWSEEQSGSWEGEQTLGTEGGCHCKDEPSPLRQPGNWGRKPGGERWFHFSALRADAASLLRFTQDFSNPLAARNRLESFLGKLRPRSTTFFARGLLFISSGCSSKNGARSNSYLWRN